MRIDDYVSELHSALRGPHGPKHDLVVEARDSLVDTADALEGDGLTRAEAERLAVEEFGRVREIAPGYQAELTATAGRRMALLLLVSLPATVLMWSLVWRFYPDDVTSWTELPAWYGVVSRLLDLLQLAVGVYGGLALLALGRGSRWIARPHLVTRSLGLAVWVMLPVTSVLGLLMSQDNSVSAGLGTFPAVLLVSLLTYACAGVQLYCATRCIRLSRTA
ncbi:permease prefix domain 1-containing protein [Nonomuraea glycinis]|uniref:permease prefix domain 1-containing protein n=1 Tax=Nonomuraea glycinis TaxID=2047744 RepID=UPI002E104472|nr:permease prefix domain 1-containing protein [Nonomuraea glycinis]